MNDPPVVLIIEDDPDSRAYLSAVITDSGYRVRALGDDESLFDVMISARPAVVILDMLLPNRSGAGLYRQVRLHPDFSAIPVILVSGLDVQAVSEALSQGEPPVSLPDRIVEKPISPTQLAEMVAGLVPLNKKGAS